ncbi:endonuclease domain-containing protein [Deinococcus sp. AJ005]|uniref:endonuclease domain-containing protein n=1 Tax=Deinococcus sp. AJ005 TaxID=2652443 RepID=UPI00125CB641|nr:DUF559 domain-containing protein [Deinococcus sp. AJ005]QFP75797.1 endonuclease domain-containing protein [Deinococcus sp. AJ005]
MSYRPPPTHVSTELARTLRRNMTPEERLLWRQLRSAQLGVSFRRQEVIGRYVVDFVCYPARLIVELDGSQHLNSETDRVRDTALQADGFHILRFWNNEVKSNLNGVLERIQAKLK